MSYERTAPHPGQDAYLTPSSQPPVTDTMKQVMAKVRENFVLNLPRHQIEKLLIPIQQGTLNRDSTFAVKDPGSGESVQINAGEFMDILEKNGIQTQSMQRLPPDYRNKASWQREHMPETKPEEGVYDYIVEEELPSQPPPNAPPQHLQRSQYHQPLQQPPLGPPQHHQKTHQAPVQHFQQPPQAPLQYQPQHFPQQPAQAPPQVIIGVPYSQGEVKFPPPAAPVVTPQRTTNSQPRKNTKKYLIIGGAILLAVLLVIAVVVGLAIGLSGGKDSSDDSSSSGTGKGTQSCSSKSPLECETCITNGIASEMAACLNKFTKDIANDPDNKCNYVQADGLDCVATLYSGCGSAIENAICNQFKKDLLLNFPTCTLHCDY